MSNLNNPALFEGLLQTDLEDMVSEVFTVDRYTSKMGEDRDILVLAFRVKEKYPAQDLMEFLEKGYTYILDADMSTGEENDGQYQVFVEIERTIDIPKQLENLLSGISQLTNCRDWRFRYQKSKNSVEFTEHAIKENIPLTPEEYDQKITDIKQDDIREFFDQGGINIAVESNNDLTFSKPYSGDVTAKFISIGDYNDVKETLPGALSLDESSQSQMLFLNKYLGNYDINKIGDKFLIRNGGRAIVLQKNRW
jgi:hypothetical protein